jgi:hypothetical protein
MKKLICVVAILAAASTAAVAKDLKGNLMTDSEMDKVTAGSGFGVQTAVTQGGSPNIGGTANPGIGTAGENGGLGFQGNIPGVRPMFGNCTAGQLTCG